MSFFTSVEQFKNILLVRGYEEDGTPISYKTSGDDIHVALYVKDKNGKSKFKSLDGEPTKELKFDSIAEANEFKKSYSNEFSFLGDFPFPNQYINQKNLSSSINTDLINIGLFDLECESKFGFPSIKEAKEVVTVISCYSTKSKILSCFALTDESNKIDWNEDIELNVVYCSSEKELLRRFLSYWREEKFDLISGWNCLPLSQSLWTKDKIVTIKDSNENHQLYDSNILDTSDVILKLPSTITLSNGTEITSSLEHKFPIFYLPKDKFINPININLISDEKNVSEIKEIIESNSIYLRQELRLNCSHNLTYREFIINNLDTLVKKGFNIVVRDSLIVRSVTKQTKKSSCLNLKFSDWDIETISKILSKDDVIEFLKRNTVITVFSPDINKSSFELNLDEIISNDLLWLAGIWYTDGTQSFKTEITITNTNESISKKVVDVFSTEFKGFRGKLGKRSEKNKCFSVRAGLSSFWFIKLFTYASVKSRSKKEIDITLLSQLSKSQFLSFFGGCVDGDGWISNETKVHFCNYDGDIKKFSELLNWNGIFNTVKINHLCCYLDDDFHQYIFHSEKNEKLQTNNNKNSIRKSKSNNLKHIIKEDYALVRIKSIIDSSEEMEMMDISTDTKYFISNGIKTHNSSFFDMPYLYNRIINVLSKKEADSLSFWGKASVKEIEKMNKKMTKVYLLGTPHLDYLDVYKKFILKPRENHRLDTIAEIELKQKKLDYSEYESIQDFWEKNPSKFILYNLIDVFLIIRLEEKLKLLALALIFSFTAKQNFEDVYSPVKTWESLCYNYLYEQKMVVPKSFRGGKDESFAGAYVKEVPPGFYKDVISFDVTSLYPSLIQLLNVSPETLVTANVDPEIQNRNLVSSLLNGELKEYNKHKELNLTLSANGQFYKKDKMGLIPKLMKELMDKRKEAKTKMIEYKKELEEINAQLKELN